MTTAGSLPAAAYFNYRWRLELEFAPHRFRGAGKLRRVERARPSGRLRRAIDKNELGRRVPKKTKGGRSPMPECCTTGRSCRRKAMRCRRTMSICRAGCRWKDSLLRRLPSRSSICKAQRRFGCRAQAYFAAQGKCFSGTNERRPRRLVPVRRSTGQASRRLLLPARWTLDRAPLRSRRPTAGQARLRGVLQPVARAHPTSPSPRAPRIRRRGSHPIPAPAAPWREPTASAAPVAAPFGARVRPSVSQSRHFAPGVVGGLRKLVLEVVDWR